MKLSKQTADAIEILACCMRLDAGKPIKVAEIAETVGLSRPMALQLCYMLQQEGLLDAVRGPNGGVRPSQRSALATLGEIVRALELAPSDSRAEGRESRFGGFADEAFDAFLSVLDQHTVADLASGPRVAFEPSRERRARTAPGRAGSGPK